MITDENGNKKIKTIYWHREILKRIYSDVEADVKLDCDHSDNDKCNNRQENLRYLTHAENCKRKQNHNKNTNILEFQKTKIVQIKRKNLEHVLKWKIKFIIDFFILQMNPYFGENKWNTYAHKSKNSRKKLII